MKTVTKRSAALLLLSLLMVVTAQAAMVKGPYLIYPGVNTQMTVLWQLNVTEGCTIDWGLDTSYSSGTINTTEYDTSHQHKATPTGLTPGSKYFYRVLDSVGYSYGSFRAAPADTATDVKFFVYGDTRTNPSIHETVAGQVVTTYTADPDYQTMILFSADFVSDGGSELDWTNQWFVMGNYNMMKVQAELPYIAARGNHEGTGTLLRKYYPYQTYADGYCYSFEYGPIFVGVIDQYVDISTTSWQYQLLLQALASTTKEWKILLFHEPAYGADDNSNDTYFQEIFQPLAEAYGVAILFAGHRHHYAHSNVNGITHITTGGGGAPLYSVSSYPWVITAEETHHHCEVEINAATGLTLTARRDNGSIIETFNIPTPPVPLPQAFNPNPADGAAGVSTTADLSWSAGKDANSHDVYFGTDYNDVNDATDPDVLPGRGNQTATTFDPGILDYPTTYYWRIDEVNEADPNIWPGWVWSFAVGSYFPMDPSPADGYQYAAPDANLTWLEGYGALRHKVWFGTVSPPPFTGVTVYMPDTTYDPPGDLTEGVTYYWQIYALDGPDGNKLGPIWSFTVNYQAADLDTDGDVDFADYATFTGRWMDEGCAEPGWCDGTDLNKSGSVDLYDLAEFVEYWLLDTSP